MIPEIVKFNDLSFRPSVKFTHFYKEIVSIEIVNWSIDPTMKNWNYYLYLFEKRMPKETFAAIWLPDIEKEFESLRTWITHDTYSSELLNSIDMHGGITAYEKIGYTEGHRTVKIGCDYAHLYDREHGDYDINQIISDAVNSAEQAIEKLAMAKKAK
jgi:hypothetical protein